MVENYIGTGQVPVNLGFELPNQDERHDIYTPDQKEEQFVRRLMKMYEKAKEHRGLYDAKWLEYYKFFRGRQWLEQRPSYRHSEVINFVWQLITSTCADQTEARPVFTFLPEEPTDREFGSILQEITEADWEKENWLYPLSEIILESNLFGHGLGYLGYDSEDNFGLGKVCFESVDPLYFYIEEDARDINHKDCSCVITAEPKLVSWVKRKHPEKAPYIREDLQDFSSQDKTELDPIKFQYPTDTNQFKEGLGSREHKKSDRVLYLTFWFKDESTENVPRETPAGVVEETRLKYPKGRKVVVANNMVLEDVANPYEDGKFPFARLSNFILPREFYGVSELEQLKSPQQIFNKLVSFSLDVLTMMGNPIYIIDNDTGIDTDTVYNKPGLILEPNPGTRVQRLEGVQLQPYVLQLVDRMESWFNALGGQNDTIQGMNPTGVTAAAAIEDLQRAAYKRIRQKSRNLGMFLKEIGQLYFSRVMQFYSVERVFRITNNDAVKKYFKFRVAETKTPDGKSQKVAYIRPYAQNENGDWFPSEEKEIPIKGEFDVRVNTTSGLSFMKSERDQKYNFALQAGIIDGEEWLKGTEFPNAELIVERMKQKQAAMPPQPQQGVK